MRRWHERPVRTAGAVTLLMCGMAGPALAAGRPGSDGEPRQPDLGGFRQVGPLFIQPALRVKAFGYDDNLFLDRERPEGDVTATLGPQARGLVRLGRRSWITMHGAVDFTGYARHAAIGHVDTARGAEVTAWAGDLRLTASYDDGRILSRPSSEVSDRVRRDESVGRVAALYEITSATTLEVELARSALRYDTVNGVDYDLTLGHTDSALRFSARRLMGRATWAVLDLAAAGRDGRGRVGVRDLRRRETVLGLDLQAGGLVEGRLRLGLASVATPGRNEKRRQDAAGPSGRGALVFRAGSANRVKLRFRREVTSSTYGDNIYFRNDDAELSWVRHLTPELAAELGVARGWNVYPDTEPFRRRDRLAELFVGAQVRLGSAAMLVVRAGRWERDSNVTGEDRTRLVVEQSVTIPL